MNYNLLLTKMQSWAEHAIHIWQFSKQNTARLHNIKDRKWWKKIPQHSKLSNDTVPWISSTIPSQKITGKKYKSKRVSVNAVIAHSYGCWSPKKFTLITWYSIEYLKDAQGHCWQLQLEWFLRTDYLLPNSH